MNHNYLLRHDPAEPDHSGSADVCNLQQMLLDGMDDIQSHAFFLLDPDGAILTWNEGAVRTLGYRPEEVKGRHVSMLYPSSEGMQAHAAYGLNQVRQAGTFEEAGLRIGRDGKPIWAEVTMTCLRENHGPVQGIGVILRDVTAERALWLQREDIARGRAQQLQQVAEISQAIQQEMPLHDVLQHVVNSIGQLVGADRCVFWMYDERDGDFQPASVEYRRTSNIPAMLGSRCPFPLVQFQSMDSFEAWSIRNMDQFLPSLPPEDRAMVLSHQVKSLLNVPVYYEKAQKKYLVGVLRAHMVTRQRHWDEDTVELVKNVASQAAIAIVQTRLIEQLNESEKRFGIIADSAPVMIWAADATGSVIYLNKSWLDFTGVSLEAQLGDGWLSQVHPDEQDAVVWDPYMRAVAVRRPFELEYHLRRYDGVYRWVLDRGTPMFTGEGVFTGYVGSVVDITQHKESARELEWHVQQRTAQLQAVNAELEAFVDAVAHELKAPLRSIRGFSNILMKTQYSQVDAKGREYLQYIEENVQRMDLLMGDLLKLSRVSRVGMTVMPVNLTQLAREIIDNLRQLEPNRKVEADIGENIQVDGDPVLLRAMLFNLLENAWKFTSRQQPVAKIRFDVFYRGLDSRQPVYYVKDNGIGFGMQDAQTIFQPFVRLRASSEDYPGTGIGLTTVQRIVHRHGGEVWAEGEPGHGATFYFTLSPRLEVLQSLPRRHYAKTLFEGGKPARSGKDSVND